MRYLKYYIWVLLLAVMACEESSPELSTVELEAEILGQDYTRWICGGGWIIATQSDTVTVFDIPNEDIKARLASGSFTGDEPLKVKVIFDETPTSTCAVEFGDRVKEVTFIGWRE